jgi:hypothetical protein
MSHHQSVFQKAAAKIHRNSLIPNKIPRPGFEELLKPAPAAGFRCQKFLLEIV